MFGHSLTFIALVSFSIVSNATAIPMDADQLVSVAIQNAVIHKEVAQVQGGGFDKDVGEALAMATIAACQNELACTNDAIAIQETNDSHSLNSWFVVQEGSGALEPIMVLILIVAVLAIVLSRKSTSTK